MSAITFPNSPSVNDIHTVNGIEYTWDGTKWTGVRSSLLVDDTWEIKTSGSDLIFLYDGSAVSKLELDGSFVSEGDIESSSTV